MYVLCLFILRQLFVLILLVFSGIRNYQIVDKTDNAEGAKNTNKASTHLVEIGPRLVLIPIRIFNGSLGGATLYQNMAYVSPNEERSALKKTKGNSYKERVAHNKERVEQAEAWQPEPDELAGVKMFKQ